LLIDLADLLQSTLQLAIGSQAAADLSNLLLRQADVANDTAGIADGEYGDGMALAASAFGASGAMADGAVEEGAAKNVAGVGKIGEEAVAFTGELLVIHY